MITRRRHTRRRPSMRVIRQVKPPAQRNEITINISIDTTAFCNALDDLVRRLSETEQ